MTCDNAQPAYVFDDEPEIGAVLCQMLAERGFDPKPFSAPRPFLEEVKVTPPGLIVLDLSLGQTDAVEIMQHLERLQYRGKVLLISGRYASTLSAVKNIGVSRGLAMLRPLQKPFAFNDLAQRLDATPEIVERTTTKWKQKSDTALITTNEALRNQWLELWYQPKIDLNSLNVHGAEALLRLRHPTRGIFSPQHFLPPPADPQLLPLTKFVVRQVLADWSYLAANGVMLKLAINVPVSIVRSPDFIAAVRQSRPVDSRFPGLTIEVTEDETIHELEWMQEIAAQLKLHNISLSIDDFGSGYSSLSRLRELPWAEVKLDRGIVKNCSSDEGKFSICSAAIKLAHEFGATVCAEGVDNMKDLRALIGLRCDTAQGFIFAKPMRVAALLDILSVHPGNSSDSPDITLKPKYSSFLQ